MVKKFGLFENRSLVEFLIAGYSIFVLFVMNFLTYIIKGTTYYTQVLLVHPLYLGEVIPIYGILNIFLLYILFSLAYRKYKLFDRIMTVLFFMFAGFTSIPLISSYPPVQYVGIFGLFYALLIIVLSLKEIMARK